MLPSGDEIALCISIMERIAPSDLLNLTPDLTAAGHALFAKSVKVDLFGDDDVVSFFKQKEDYKLLLKKLERVHSEVQRAHADFVEVSEEQDAHLIKLRILSSMRLLCSILLFLYKLTPNVFFLTTYCIE